jgi:predicted deacetylase
MLSRPAQYLLRFDDLCPTLQAARWRRFLPLIEEYGISPILAVVPDNRDRKLEAAPENAGFWGQMRALEAAGATIGLHGFRHLCQSTGRSLIPLHRRSEFAGVAAETQRKWIHAGLLTLEAHGLHPKVWVAPRHGFDRKTLWALRKEGIFVLSDGFGRVPFQRGGVVWIPQQLWAPSPQEQGLWTICIHSNTASDSSVERLSTFLRQHAAQFTSVARVLEEYRPGRRGIFEGLYAGFQLARLRIARALKSRRRGARTARRG